tara:strand:+ start:708 stop:1703 length:996 start_codon:yes stop_codon:yes gene_type:complete
MKSMNNERVLITGGTGFIGHHLVKYLLENTTYDIISIDRIDTSSSLSRLQNILSQNPEWKKRVKIVWHDLKSAFNEYVVEQIGDVDYILHLAAGSHVDRSVKNPLQFIMDNVIGTTNVLEYARSINKSLKLFLNFSTDEVFGPATNGEIFKEDDRHNPCNPYSASKSAAEQICNAYRVTYNIPLITTHTMNVYGIRQSGEKFIPLVIRKLCGDEEIAIHTDSQNNIGSRKYLHTSDVCAAILLLMRQGHIGEKYNISADREVDNLSLAKEISCILEKELKYRLECPTKTRGVNDIRYSISGEKIRQLGWAPKVTLKQGLTEVVRWHTQEDA